VYAPQKPLTACITGANVQNRGLLIHEPNLAS
jgi:hypothetical protein